jgi:hypothetical protein
MVMASTMKLLTLLVSTWGVRVNVINTAFEIGPKRAFVAVQYIALINPCFNAKIFKAFANFYCK